MKLANVKNPNHPAAGGNIKVEPIRRLEDIKAIKKYLAGKPRDLTIFTIGINTNLRAGELLQLKIGQVGDMKVGCDFRTSAQNARRNNFAPMNATVYKSIIKLLQVDPLDQAQDETDFLFQSKKRKGQALTSPTLSNMVKQWCADIRLHGNYGAESLRKTFGYHQLVTFGVDAQTVAKIFGCNSRRKLFKYLGVQEAELKKVSLKEL